MLRLLPAVLLVLLSLAACREPARPLPHPYYPDTTAAALKPNTLPPDLLYDKVLGMLLGSAIGDAMGAPTEMWSREQMQLEYGHIETLDSMVREPSPEGTWDYNLPAGGTTDDTRWKVLMVDFMTGTADKVPARQAVLGSKAFAQLLIDRYQEGVDALRATEATEADPYEAELRRILWLKEWVRVARPYVAGDLDAYADALSQFYGGEMVCGGMLFAPAVGGLYPGDPVWAYEQAFALDIYDIGYARDIAGLTAAMTAAAMDTAATPASVMRVVREVDPRGYFRSRLVGRSAYQHYQAAAWIARAARRADPEAVLRQPPVELALPLRTYDDSLRYAQWSVAFAELDKQLQRLPFHPGEIYLITLTAMMVCDFDFGRTLELMTNYGRDNDTSAAVAGGIMGAYYGASGLPPEARAQVLAVNRQIGIDIEAMAQRMTQSILGGSALP